jgi:hypothetical protein
MKWTPWILGSLAAFAMGACGGERQDTETSGSGTETGTMQGGAATDTTIPGTGTTGTTGGATGATGDTMHSDSTHGTGTAHPAPSGSDTGAGH